jgi:hypothetical protein
MNLAILKPGARGKPEKRGDHMEDEHYDESLWERYEDEGQWNGWQGRYSNRYDSYF